METEALRQKLVKELPPIFTRQTAVKATGGLIAAGTLANLDSQGKGPPEKVRMGRKVAYLRAPFVDWFVKRISKQQIQPPPKKGGRKIHSESGGSREAERQEGRPHG